jgi:hypothetical protein
VARLSASSRSRRSALALFAQIGMITHLYSLLVPALGNEWADW